MVSARLAVIACLLACCAAIHHVVQDTKSMKQQTKLVQIDSNSIGSLLHTDSKVGQDDISQESTAMVAHDKAIEGGASMKCYNAKTEAECNERYRYCKWEGGVTKEEAAKQMSIERQNQHVPGMATKSAAQLSASKVSQSVGAAPTQDAAKPGETEAKKPAAKTETVSLTCPEEKIGRVIGPKGSNLKLVQEKSGCGRIDTEGGVFTVSGPAEAVVIAEAALRELIDKGYTSLAFDNFNSDSVMVHPSCFPDLIGTQGAVIRKIKESLKVEVSIPPVPKNAPPGKKYPVTIAGAKADADKAKEVIESIIYYYHHEITHEGLEHVELEIDPWSYSYIIGTKGSELKHIQKNYDVRLYIPREHSANHNVVVVGSKKDCDRTKAYIDKLILKASEPRGGGRGADGKADDHWGKDDAKDEEPWMQQYMYKRK